MTAKKTAAASPTKQEVEWQEMHRSRIAPLEQVTQEQLVTIRDLQEKLKVAEAAARGAKEWMNAAENYKAELIIYRTLVKGWPKGRKIVKALKRDPLDY